MRFLRSLHLFLMICASVSGAAQVTPLKSVQKARELSFSEAKAGTDVDLEGVVTYLRDATKEQFNFNLNDDSGGVMIYPSELIKLLPGQRVRVKGKTTISIHGLRIQAVSVEPGEIQQLPIPEIIPVEALRLRENVGRYVQVEATLRSARLESPLIQPRRLALDLGSGTERVTAWILHYQIETDRFIPGQTIRLTGVPLHWTNARGQMQFVSLMVNSSEDIQSVAPPNEPTRQKLSEVLLWNGPMRCVERVTTSGVVTYHKSGDFFVLQDGVSAIRVRATPLDGLNASPFSPALWDRVEVTGFPVMGEYTVELEDTEVQKLGTGKAPPPEECMGADEVLRGGGMVDRNGRLIRVSGTLVNVRAQDGQHALELKSEGRFFKAFLPDELPLPEFLRPGAELQLNGICLLQLSAERRRLGMAPDQFSLLMSSPALVELLRAAPWWNDSRLWIVLGLLAAAAFITGLWAASTARRNTSLRTEIARREAAESGLLSERMRLAGDLHDTLEQTLLAANLQLNAATRSLDQHPESAVNRLALATQLLDRSRQEVREAVWDLHRGGGQSQLLGALLQAACREAGALSSTQVLFTGPHEDPFLSAHLCAQAVRIVRECLTNAFKHAAPAKVQVRLDYDVTQLQLAISDDGRGFDPDAVAGPESGHFGLVSLRERVQRLGGTIQITSAPSKGTRIEATIPLETP
jgi:signal transduction histidine kinase